MIGDSSDHAVLGLCWERIVVQRVICSAKKGGLVGFGYPTLLGERFETRSFNENAYKKLIRVSYDNRRDTGKSWQEDPNSRIAVIYAMNFFTEEASKFEVRIESFD